MIEDLKKILTDIKQVNERVDRALSYHYFAPVYNNSKIMGLLLDSIDSRVTHIEKQLENGIKILTDLCKLAEQTKDMDGVEIYVLPWVQEFDSTDHPYHHDLGSH